jgi:ATP-dependent DNA ligase
VPPDIKPFPRRAGPESLHEIKHDGYRMLAHHDGERVRLMSRHGLDWGCGLPIASLARRRRGGRHGEENGTAGD